MKHKIKILLFIFCYSALFKCFAAESGPGNGTDYVQVLFADAKVKVGGILDSVSNNDINNLAIDNNYKEWLSANINGNSRLMVMKYYAKKINYIFQQQPCSDQVGNLSGICFYNQDPNNPLVIISKERNVNTTTEQAMIMLIHEIGHFTGELNHLFLDEFAAQFVTAMLTPRFQIIKAEDVTSQIYASIFNGKDECDRGVSEHAQNVKMRVENKLRELCLENNLKCDFVNAIYTYTGTINFKPGVGYDMSVSCHVQGVVKGIPQ